MPTTTHIYTLSDPLTNEIRYIGKADDIKTRAHAHFYETARTRKCNWVKNLKSRGLSPKIEILDIVDKNGWELWESFYIQLFKSWGFNLVNATTGGSGISGFKMSEETKEKVRQANIGKKASEETKQKMRNSSPRFWQGKKMPEEMKEKLSKSHKGKKLPPEQIAKMIRKGERHHFFGKNLTEEHKAKLWVNRSRIFSIKAKQNMSEGAKRGWEKRRNKIAA